MPIRTIIPATPKQMRFSQFFLQNSLTLIINHSNGRTQSASVICFYPAARRHPGDTKHIRDAHLKNDGVSNLSVSGNAAADPGVVSGTAQSSEHTGPARTGSVNVECT